MHSSPKVEDKHMRSTISFAVAALLATSMAAAAQTTKTETKIKGGHDAHMVTYTGCVRSGVATTGYMLENAVPVQQTTTVGTSGEAQTVTTWALVPDHAVQLAPEIGHKVQVTGVEAKGDVTIETKTKTNGQPEVKSEQKIDGDHHVPQFHVVSMRDLNEPCS
jgi:hypothetical protein